MSSYRPDGLPIYLNSDLEQKEDGDDQQQGLRRHLSPHLLTWHPQDTSLLITGFSQLHRGNGDSPTPPLVADGLRLGRRHQPQYPIYRYELPMPTKADGNNKADEGGASGSGRGRSSSSSEKKKNRSRSRSTTTTTTRYLGHTAQVMGMVWLPDGERFVSGIYGR